MQSSPERPRVIFLYDVATRYGVNALAGALEVSGESRCIEELFCPTLDALTVKLEQCIAKDLQVLVALSFASARRPEILTWIRKMRDAMPGQKWLAVAGGPDPSAFPERSLEAGADYVVIGEGEWVFPQLVHRWRQSKDASDLPGLVMRKAGGMLQRNGRPEPISLDKYPPFPLERPLCGAIELTRGCPHVCCFCQVPALHGVRPRHRGLEMLLASVDSMLETDRQDFRFVTPDAFAYGSTDGRHTELDTLEEMLGRLRDRVGKIRRIYLGSFPSEVRPEHVTKKGVEIIRRYCDNDNLVVGAQAGSDHLLELCHRQHRVDDVVRAVEIIAAAGLRANVDFIFGLPGEREKDLEQTLSLMDKLVEMGARIHTHTFMPLPQTRFAGRRPGRVDARLRRRLEKYLVPKGLAYGNWRRQERLARRLGRDQGRAP